MEFKCDYSKLTLPNDITYLTVASNYVGEIAAKFGFDRQDRSTIEEGIREVLGRIIHYSFEPLEKAEIEIACERVPEGLKVVITDQGLPLDPASPPKETVRSGIAHDSEDLSWLDLFSRYMDEVYFLNLGYKGKQTVLIKHSRGEAIEDYFQACELGPYSVPPLEKHRDETRFSIRQMEPSEAVEVAKAIYKAYGYSYAVEHLYYPERIEEYNRAGSMVSMVAVTDDNEIAAHGALVRHDRWPLIVEMGQGVVIPEFRGHGCFNLLSDQMVEKARSLGYMGVFSQAVTVHLFSQQTVHRCGLRDCAIKLGYVPAYMSYKGISEKASQRITLVLDFKYLSAPANVAIYPPLHHRDMILKLYERLGFKPQALTPMTDELPANTSSIASWGYSRPGLGEIHVERFGRNIVPEVRRRLKEMCISKIEMITLWLDLSDPAVFHLTEEFEAMGFFFSGILPGAGAGDALILQYLNNMALDYNEIRLESDMAKELLLYIRDRDPNIVD